MADKTWENSEYKKHVRVTEKQHAQLVKEAGKGSIAGKLEEIINYYFKSK